MAVDNLITDRDIPRWTIRPLCLFAHFAALALGNALRAQDLHDLNHKLHRLVDLSGTFTGILRPDDLLEQILTALPELLRADRASAYRRRSEDTWTLVATYGSFPSYQAEADWLCKATTRRNCVGERLFRAGEPV